MPLPTSSSNPMRHKMRPLHFTDSRSYLPSVKIASENRTQRIPNFFHFSSSNRLLISFISGWSLIMLPKILLFSNLRGLAWLLVKQTSNKLKRRRETYSLYSYKLKLLTKKIIPSRLHHLYLFLCLLSWPSFYYWCHSHFFIHATLENLVNPTLILH